MRECRATTTCRQMAMIQDSVSESLASVIVGEFFASAIASYPDCVRVLDLEGRVEFMNPRGLALFEIDVFEPNQGRYWPSLWPEETRAAVEEALNAALSGEVRSFQAFCPTAKGTPKWWDTVVFPVFISGDAKPVRLLARSRDITKERETRSLLDAVVQNIPAVLVAKEVGTGRFVLVNRAAEKILGLSHEEIIGKTDHDFFSPEQAAVFQNADMDVFASGEVRIFEEEVRTERGGVRHFRTKKIGLLDEAGVGHIVAIAEDVTESKIAAETLREALVRAEAASRAKSDFLATMSHEIRTPLNGVLGMAQAMEADQLTQAQRDRLKVIRRSGETLLSILNDILDLSRIEAGKIELELADFDMEHLVRGAAAAFAPLAEQKGVSFGLSVEPEARATFNGDATRIRRLLYNLISNAVKFTDCGQIQVMVAYRSGTLIIEVVDTGIGIPAEQLPTLFDKFIQGDASYTRRFGGSGLGLAICRGLTERMSGDIDVASTVGQGSTFTIKIPLVRVSSVAEEDTPPQVEAPEPQESQSELKVLAAEDNEVNQLVLRTLLEQAGVAPLIVGNGAEAVAAWEREPWDIILMDIQMPVMDGVSATRAIRTGEAASGRMRTPILAVTANAMTHQVPEYLAAGMDAVVPKPLEAAQLFAALEQALDEAGRVVA